MCVCVCVCAEGEGSWRSHAGLCGVAFGPLFGYPVVLGSVGQVLCGDASNQRVGWNTRGRNSVILNATKYLSQHLLEC